MNALYVSLALVIAVAAVHGYPEPPQSKETPFRQLRTAIDTVKRKAMVKIFRNTQEVVKKLCAEQTKVNPDEVEKLKNGDFDNQSKEAMCYVNCYISGLGVMKDGVFQHKEMAEAVQSLLPPEHAQRAIAAMAQCKEPMGENDCEKAFELSKCFKSIDMEIAKKIFYPSMSE